MDRPRQAEPGRTSPEDPLQDGSHTAADRHVHYNHAAVDGDLQSPNDPLPRRRSSRKRINSYHERDSKGGFERDATSRPLARKTPHYRPKRSMTLPDERLGHPDDDASLTGIWPGLGIGVPATAMRIPRGSPRISEYSDSSDEVTSVSKPLSVSGPSSSFRQKRIDSAAVPGPSRYPGMLQIPDSNISPRTIQKRRMASTGSTPDTSRPNSKLLAQRSSSPIRISVPSPSHSSHVASVSRLQALVDDSIPGARDRRRSQSPHTISSMDDRSSRRRRISSITAIPDANGGHQDFQDSSVFPAIGAEGIGATTPTSIHPPSRSRRNSVVSARVLGHSFKTRKGSKDSESSTRGANGDDSMNQERADVANTVSRKRKQSEDHTFGSQRRSMSTDRMDSLAETKAVKNGKNGHGDQDGKFKQRAPLDDLGFEATLSTSQLEKRHSSDTSATLDHLLSSIDIANAMRLIQKQTVLPAGAIDQDTLEPNRSTIRVSPQKKQRTGRPSEMFVPRAPPSILHTDGQPEHAMEKSERAGGHVAFKPPLRKVSSSDDAQSVRSHPVNAPGPRLPRLTTSSSAPSGFFGTKRHASVSSPNSSNKVIDTEGSRTQASARTPASSETNHKRSISERFSLSHHLMSHGKKSKPKEFAPQREVDDEAVIEAKDMASFQERIQSALLELSHHPRAEKLAYQARSYLQAYYSNIYASLRGQVYDSDPVPPHDPLAVIRWRNDVRAEDAKRRAYEAARSSTRALSPGSATGSAGARKDNSILSLNSPDGGAAYGRSPSKPLHSAELLNRIDQSDTGKHLKSSPALREWIVTPSETVAYINCKGVVDHFIPPAQNGGSLWGEIPSIDRSPSTMTASSTRTRSVTSPSSRMWLTRSPPIGNVVRSPSSYGEGVHEPDKPGGERRRGSVDAGDRIASVIKSPLRSIRRHIHPHSERDLDGQTIMTSDTENEASKHIRRYALVNTANRFRMKAHASKEEIEQVETVPYESRESVPISGGEGVDRPETNRSHRTSISDNAQTLPVPRTLEGTSVRSDVFDVMPTEVEDDEYRQRLRTLQSVETALGRTPDVERESESVIDDFVSIVDVFRVQRRCLMVQEDLNKARMVRSAYMRRKGISHSGGGDAETTTSNHQEAKEDITQAKQERAASAAQVASIDPLDVVKDIIRDLHERYDIAVRQALDVCRKQDDVQRKASELLPVAEHLLSRFGDRVRKLRGIRESFYTLDAIQSSHSPAYYSVVNAGILIVGWFIQGLLLLARYVLMAMGLLFKTGSFIAAFLRMGVINFGSTMMTFAALLAGIGIGAIIFKQGS